MDVSYRSDPDSDFTNLKLFNNSAIFINVL